LAGDAWTARRIGVSPAVGAPRAAPRAGTVAAYSAGCRWPAVLYPVAFEGAAPAAGDPLPAFGPVPVCARFPPNTGITTVAASSTGIFGRTAGAGPERELGAFLAGLAGTLGAGLAGTLGAGLAGLGAGLGVKVGTGLAALGAGPGAGLGVKVGLGLAGLGAGLGVKVGTGLAGTPDAGLAGTPDAGLGGLVAVSSALAAPNTG
jgi:hypothetical protein